MAADDALAAATRRAEQTYNAAADHFDDAPLAFWDRYGRGTIARLGLHAGASVLDVCSGTGASAIPAAQAAGPGGRVVAVDVADQLLARGREKALAAGLRNVDFRRGDMTALDLPAGTFDAVVCVFGIFFVPDMPAQVAALRRLVKPGGQLAITTWGPDMFGPGYEIWRRAVRRVRPDLYTAFNPWDRITTPAAVRQLFADAGLAAAAVAEEAGEQPLRSAEDFWTIVLGSGLRWTVDALTPDECAAVRRETLDTLAARDVRAVATNVIYAVARAE